MLAHRARRDVHAVRDLDVREAGRDQHESAALLRGQGRRQCLGRGVPDQPLHRWRDHRQDSDVALGELPGPPVPPHLHDAIPAGAEPDRQRVRQPVRVHALGVARDLGPVHHPDPERTIATGVAQRPVVAVGKLDLVDDVPVRAGQRRTDGVAPDERRQPLEHAARGEAADPRLVPRPARTSTPPGRTRRESGRSRTASRCPRGPFTLTTGAGPENGSGGPSARSESGIRAPILRSHVRAVSDRDMACLRSRSRSRVGGRMIT